MIEVLLVRLDPSKTGQIGPDADQDDPYLFENPFNGLLRSAGIMPSSNHPVPP